MTVEKQNTTSDKPTNSENKNVGESSSTGELLGVGKGASRANKSTKTKVGVIQNNEELMKIIERIDLCSESEKARELQCKAFTAIAESLRKGKTGGVIKLPTGTGKTWIFAVLLMAFQKNGLILVPRVDLYDSTARDLAEVGFSNKNIHFVHEQEGRNTEDRMMSLLNDPSIDWKTGKNQCIMTYQALTSMVRKNPEMGIFIRSHFDIVIEDEAHRGLGDKTQDVTSKISHQSVDQVYDIANESHGERNESSLDEMDDNISEIEEITYEEQANKIIDSIKYNYKFTATPDLIGKSVSEDGEYIFYATVEEAVRTRAIVLPQYVDMGSAYTKDANLDSWKVADIEKLSEGDNFVDESGKSIREKIIEAYMEKKNEHGTLPGVAFASTIEHARQIVEAFEAKGIRATRVTSGSGDISSKEANRRMDIGELDVIVTVTKVSEGFDYPPLACAMWFCPSLSPAKIFQGNGRVMRMTYEKMPEEIEDNQGRLIPSPKTYIIAPSIWYGGTSRIGDGNNTPEDSDGSEGETLEKELADELESINEKGSRDKPLPRIGNFYELLIDRGEIDINSIWGNLRDSIDMKASIRCEPGEEKEIDGVVYVGVTQSNEVMGVKGFTILSNLKNNTKVMSHRGRQKNGFSITLVPKSFIESLRVDHTCEPDEEKVIDGVVYVGVTKRNEVMGISGQTILNNLKRNSSVLSYKGRQKNGANITLVPKSFIESLRVDYVCEPGEEQEIDGVVYVGVTQSNEVMGVKGQTILDNLKNNPSILIHKGRRKGGTNITLIPKSFIESLGVDYVCEPGEEQKIKGAIYVGVSASNEVMGVKGQTILKNLKRNSSVLSYKGRQKNGYSITLVPKSFIEGLKKKIKK